MANEVKTPIPARLYNAAVGGHVAGADDIIDDKTGMVVSELVGNKPATSEENPFNGMGVVVLPMNIQEVEEDDTTVQKNILTQAMMNQTNTKYVIKYDYVLGEDITIPANCVLEFDGGSISGAYTLTGANTSIKAKPRVQIFSGVDIQGIWNVTDIYVEWMNIPNIYDCGNEIRSIMRLQNSNMFQEIFTPSFDLAFTPMFSDDASLRSLFILSSNTHLHITNTLRVNQNESTHYDAILAENVKNVIVDGGGSIIGDVVTNYAGSGEWGHGISFINVKNSEINNLNISLCKGDGIYVEGGKDGLGDFSQASEDIVIRNVKCISNRRDGIALLYCRNISVFDSDFCKTGYVSGTPNCKGLDIEPNMNYQKAQYIYFENCKFNENTGDNMGGAVYINATTAHSIENVTFRHCEFDSVLCDGQDGDGYSYVLGTKRGINISASVKNVSIYDSFIRQIINHSVGGTPINVYNSTVGGVIHYEVGSTFVDPIIFKDCDIICGKVQYIGGDDADKNQPFYFRTPVNLYFYNCNIDISENKVTNYSRTYATTFTHYFDCDIKTVIGTPIDLINCTCTGQTLWFHSYARGIQTRYINTCFTNNQGLLLRTPVQYPGTSVEEIDLILRNVSFLGSYIESYHHRAGRIIEWGEHNNHDTGFINGNITISGVSSIYIRRMKDVAADILSNAVGEKKIDYNEPWFDNNNKPLWYNGTTWVDATGTPV